MFAEEEINNFSSFQDCVATSIVAKLTAPGKATKTSSRQRRLGRKTTIKPVIRGSSEGTSVDDAAELSDFIEYLAEDIFSDLPEALRTLSFAAIQDDAALAIEYSSPLNSSVVEQVAGALSGSIVDSLCSYDIVGDTGEITNWLEPILNNYMNTVTAAPHEYTPADSGSRPDGCEVCEREHLPLTYHHLIPRQMHDKAVKRGWHAEWELNKVAWLCRACHSYVHRIASNEALAQELYSVELLMQRDDMQKWAAWVGRVRWKAR